MKPGEEVTLKNGMKFRIFQFEILGPSMGDFSARPVDKKCHIKHIFFDKSGKPISFMCTDPDTLEQLKIDRRNK